MGYIMDRIRTKTYKRHYTDEEKKLIIDEYMNYKMSVEQICQRHDINSATFYSWLRKTKVSPKHKRSLPDPEIIFNLMENLKKDNEEIKSQLATLKSEVAKSSRT